MSYRQQFSTPLDARAYDEREYRPGSYGDVLWQIEQEQLRAVIEAFRRTHPTIELLDFATGSGRVLSYVESMVDASVGIEVSESMAERARARVTRSTVLCRDITLAGAPVEGFYDMITAFRFVLNAELELRRAGLRALAARLRDSSSVLVFNNHGNLWSHKALLYPVHTIRRGRAPRTSGNYLTHRQITGLMAEVGLRAERVHGCGVIGGRLARWVPPTRLLRWERRLTRSRLARLGVNQIYLARLA